jgi:hypothetical protein
MIINNLANWFRKNNHYANFIATDINIDAI